MADEVKESKKAEEAGVPFTKEEAREWHEIEAEEEDVQDVIKQYQAKRSAFWARWRKRTGYPVSWVKEVLPKKVILFTPDEVQGLKAQQAQQLRQLQQAQQAQQAQQPQQAQRVPQA